MTENWFIIWKYKALDILKAPYFTEIIKYASSNCNMITLLSLFSLICAIVYELKLEMNWFEGINETEWIKNIFPDIFENIVGGQLDMNSSL